MTATPDLYPTLPSVDVTLRDGSKIHIRRVVVEDLEAIRAFLGLLSNESVDLRFFGVVDLDWASRWSVDVDYADKYGLVATAGPDEAIVAHGSYVREDADRAEMAFVVADAFHELGIATLLLAQLAAFAKAHGIAILTGVVLPHNERMIDVLRDSGYPVTLRTASDEIRVELTTTLAYVEPSPSGGWAVKLSNHPTTPVSRHDTEAAALATAASYHRGLEHEVRDLRRDAVSLKPGLPPLPTGGKTSRGTGIGTVRPVA